MNAKLKSFVLLVKNIQVSKDFYTNLLGEEIEYDFGKNISFKSGLVVWELRKEHIISQKLSDQINSNCNRCEVYYETDDLDLIYATLLQNNVKFLHHIHIEPWTQRTIRFFDPDNHLVEIGETLEAFIKRSWENHNDIDMVSKETFVPVDTVKSILKVFT